MLKYFPLLAGCALVCSASLSARILLDDVMTQADQRKTGISTLTYQQKFALEEWISRNCTMKNAPKVQTQNQLFLSINIDGGQKIQLSDDSIWQISPDDIPTASTWITPVPIQIVPSNYPDFPSLLVDTQTGNSVKAKKISGTNMGVPTVPAPSTPSTQVPTPPSQ